jgi:16S rRNA C967 or C1407 C5-methylase (RsmB/RsmF family)/NOL1/NOP2/fmu family ribosome biogenesis protein
VQFPKSFIESLEGLQGFDRESFEAAHHSGEAVTSIRLNPIKPAAEFPDFQGPLTPVPWSEYGYYLEKRPSFTFDPLFHAGCYYVQEASSMFLEQVLKQTIDLSRPVRVLDLSASPGGKSTHIQSLIHPGSLLVSNEVIRSRAQVLKDNIIKWGCPNVVVTHNDPGDFKKLEGFFDIILVDAPCSGSGLFRREPMAAAEWNDNTVKLCCQRQQRIIADIYPALKDHGILIYSTCSFSRDENEDVFDWLVADLPFAFRPIEIKNNWHITDTGKGYRFWPDKVKGEGFYIAAFQKDNGSIHDAIKIKPVLSDISGKEKEIISKWVTDPRLNFIKNENTVYAWPQALQNEFGFVFRELRVIYSGIKMGELIHNKLIPDHALAMSGKLNNEIQRIDLDRSTAISYLQRKDIYMSGWKKGWSLVTYLDQPLGWVNVLANRANNYYPNELRILKQHQD